MAPSSISTASTIRIVIMVLGSQILAANPLAPATTGRATREAARRHTRSMNSGGTTQTAASNSQLGIVIAAPEMTLQAPSVSMDMHQIATERAWEMLGDMQR